MGKAANGCWAGAKAGRDTKGGAGSVLDPRLGAGGEPCTEWELPGGDGQEGGDGLGIDGVLAWWGKPLPRAGGEAVHRGRGGGSGVPGSLQQG